MRALWRPPARPDEPLFDAAFRRRLEQLALRTRQVLAWREVGEHRSPRRSPSREFVDFRAYSQGEDLRYLDWNTYARLGELVTRLGEVSTELTAHVRANLVHLYGTLAAQVLAPAAEDPDLLHPLQDIKTVSNVLPGDIFRQIINHFVGLFFDRAHGVILPLLGLPGDIEQHADAGQRH